MTSIKKNQRGAVLFFTILIIATAGLSAMLALSRSGIDSAVDSNRQLLSINARADLMGCVNEMLTQFVMDENFSSVVIDTLDAQCTATITDIGGNNRESVLILSQSDITRGVRVEFTVEPVSVTRVIEVYN